VVGEVRGEKEPGEGRVRERGEGRERGGEDEKEGRKGK